MPSSSGVICFRSIAEPSSFALSSVASLRCRVRICLKTHLNKLRFGSKTERMSDAKIEWNYYCGLFLFGNIIFHLSRDYS